MQGEILVHYQLKALDVLYRGISRNCCRLLNIMSTIMMSGLNSLSQLWSRPFSVGEGVICYRPRSKGDYILGSFRLSVHLSDLSQYWLGFVKCSKEQ